MLRFEPVPSASETCCPTHVPREPLEFLTIVSEITKIYGATQIRNLT